MSECPECNAMAKELRLEQKRSTELSMALITIYGIAKDKMWYPSTFEERGESGFKTEEAFVAADRAAIKRVGYDK